MKNSRRKKQTRKRKRDLIAPQCRENCQINHTIEQTAALLQCSITLVQRMLDAGRLKFVYCGVGIKRKSRRVPHSAIRALEQIAA